jgi:hypothetical protein
MENSEIFIRTISVENFGKSKSTLKEGIQKTVGEGLLLPIDPTNFHKIDLDEKLPDGEKAKKFQKLLAKTSNLIETVANELGSSLKNSQNLSEMEVEFSLGFTEKLNILMFEGSSDQSIKVTMKFQKS